MRNRRHRIHWQMTFYVSCVVFGLFALFAVVDYFQQKRHLTASRVGYMAQEVRLLATAIQGERAPEKRDDFIRDYCASMQFHGRPGHGLAIIEPSGVCTGTGTSARWISHTCRGCRRRPFAGGWRRTR